jgi:hypothetical protein
MKPRFVIAVFLVLALAVPATLLAQQSKAEKEVLAVVEELQKANLQGPPENIPTFEKYLADSFIRIPTNGAVYTKADIMDGWKTGKIKVDLTELSDLKIRIYGDTAVATAIVNNKANMLGVVTNERLRWTRVFVKHNGIWQCVLFQNTPLKQ